MLLGLDETLRDLRELIERQSLGLRAQRRRHLLARGLRRIAGRARVDERARMLDRAANEETQVPPVIDEAANELHTLRAVRGGESVEQGRRLLPVGGTEQVVDLFQGDGPIGEGDDHVEHALSISERPLRVAGDRVECGRVRAELLLLDDLRELRDDPLVRDPPEVEALGAGDDRRRDLLRLRRGEDEHRVRRRLLEGLQERIERLGRELVGLIDHIHLVLPLRRGETDLVAEVAHLIDAAVRRRVDLDEVQEAAVADRDAGLAPIAGLAVLGIGAVHCLRDQPGDRGLSRAPDSRQEVGVSHLTTSDRVPERARHVLLTDDRGEGLGAVAAIESGALGHARMLAGYGRAPSVDHDVSNTRTRIGSDQACLRHEATTAYRCFLPDLTGFTGRFCTGPDRQRRRASAGSAMPDLGRGFSPARADCGYRAPLAPRLARPETMVPCDQGSPADRPSGRFLAAEQPRTPMRSIGDMRTSGLPCRANHDCEVVFTVMPQNSMDALREAAAKRNAHELEAHQYTHIATTTLGPSTFAQGPSGARRRGRRRKAEGLDVIWRPLAADP